MLGTRAALDCVAHKVGEVPRVGLERDQRVEQGALGRVARAVARAYGAHGHANVHVALVRGADGVRGVRDVREAGELARQRVALRARRAVQAEQRTLKPRAGHVRVHALYPACLRARARARVRERAMRACALLTCARRRRT